MPDFIETIINGIKAWVGAELAKLRQLVTSTRSIAEKAQETATEANAIKTNPVFTGSFSQNRKDGTRVGDFSHAEGINTTASGNYSHAEGRGTTASGQSSHAEGQATTASGQSSHAEGQATIASGYYSHAEGLANQASGSGSHAEGSSTVASGIESHAEGATTEAGGRASHAEGRGTIANGQYQHTQGKYNIKDAANKYAHIVGNGTAGSARSNAHTLDWYGVAWFQGRPQFGGTAQDDGSQTVMANGDTEIILASSTTGSTKKFKITVDDTGTLTATEVTE